MTGPSYRADYNADNVWLLRKVEGAAAMRGLLRSTGTAKV